MFLCKFNILHTGGASPSPTTENLNFVRRRHFKQKFNYPRSKKVNMVICKKHKKTLIYHLKCAIMNKKLFWLFE